MIANRIAGTSLVLIGVAGFLTVADDLRHVGEFVGVASIFLAGTILLLGGFSLPFLPVPSTRLMAGGFLLGVPLGALIDRMFVGVVLGLTLGTVVGWIRARRHRPEQGNEPPQS